MKFTELDLPENIMKGLKELGYETLTPIQESTFEHIRGGKDMVAVAETGSGKTSACAIPMVINADPKVNEIQSLILVPTRELALQYVSEISAIAKHTDVSPFAIYGGFSMQIQLGKLAHGVQILVATPGRLIDMLYNTPLKLSSVKIFVLDEADEMLNMGFITDVEFILSCMIHKHQTLLFSATMPQAIQKLTAKYLDNPETIKLNVDQIAPKTLEHHFQLVNRGNHLDNLVKYINEEEPSQAILFCNSRRNCETLKTSLKGKLPSVDVIHGGMDQSRRTSLFNKFKRKEIKFMVATDIASRGLDFSHTSHVMNYDFPMSLEAYTHRTGRTARMGRKGFAMTFYTKGELRELKRLLTVNQINPIWKGPKPDLAKVTAGKKRQPYRGGKSKGRGRPKR
jgi:ATP-dependent RNA helicase DeaD